MKLNSNELYKAVRYALAVSAVASMGVAPIAFAQDDEDADKKLETVEVVGSRIKRVDLETSQPVFVVEKEDLQRTGLTNIGDVLTNLVYADNTAVTTFTGNTNGNDGTVEVSLRNLTSDRTLVLVNGRRWISSLDGVVDLQTIPMAIVERIEVLKDGASAIYGSDAIAGVVNIVTRESYDGMEANAYVGENSEGDGRVETYDFTLGTASEKGSVISNFSYSKQESIFAGDREISSVPQFGSPAGDNSLGSASNLYGVFNVPGRGNISLIPGRPGTAPTDFQSYVPARDNYNFAPINYLQMPFERWSTYVQGRYNLTDNITFFTQGAYIKRRGTTQIAEVPLSIRDSGLLGVQWDFNVASNNFFNPFGVNVPTINYRMAALGPRSKTIDYDTWAYTSGFEGAFDALDRTFSWDVAYQYLDSQYDQRGNGYVNLFNLRNALGPSFRDAGGVLRCGVPGAVVTSCVPFNIFGGPDLGVGAGVTTPAEAAAMLDYVGYGLSQASGVDTTNYTANITGDLFELPAGPFSFAMGYEYRSTDGFSHPDALVAEGGSSDNFNLATNGNISTDEFYVELNIPVVKDAPLAELLEFNVAARYSDYQSSGTAVEINPDNSISNTLIAPDIGDTTNAKIGFKWKPITDLLVRGNWAETFRAPSVFDLYDGVGESFAPTTDPCRRSLAGTGANIYASLTPEQQARCHAQGVPVGGVVQPSSQLRNFVGGNPDLQPEMGETKTLGLVYSPSWLEGLDVSLDWYRVDLEDAISYFGGSTTLSRCIRDGQPGFCDRIRRSPTGDVGQIITTQFNAVSARVEGYDLGANYKFDTDYGKFTLGWNSTYTSKSYTRVLNADGTLDPIDNEAGELILDSATWRIRSNFGTNWQYGDWEATWNMRYLSGLEEYFDCAGFEGFAGCGADSVNRIPSFLYHDLQLAWSAPWDGKITGGIRNAFDKDPPVAFNVFAHSFPMGYDIPGRFWYVSYNQKF